MIDRRGLLSLLSSAAVSVAAAAQNAETEIQANTIHTQALPEPFSGWEARFVAVQFPAGVKSTPHHHPGFVLGYVIEGELRFAINGEAPRVLRAGEAFYEPPGANHRVGESESTRRAARILAIIIAPTGKV
jgi:quercetin dioxygenase-like cupin family protein